MSTFIHLGGRGGQSVSDGESVTFLDAALFAILPLSCGIVRCALLLWPCVLPSGVSDEATGLFCRLAIFPSAPASNGGFFGTGGTAFRCALEVADEEDDLL